MKKWCMKKYLPKCICVLFTLAWIPTVILANDVDIKVENPWARESPPGAQTGAVYLTLVNVGSETDKLIGVSGDIAETIELHTHLHEEGVMKMRRVASVDVISGEATVFKPGGLHIMLIGLTQPLRKTETFPLMLQFARAGEIAIEVTVKSLDDM